MAALTDHACEADSTGSAAVAVGSSTSSRSRAPGCRWAGSSVLHSCSASQACWCCCSLASASACHAAASLRGRLPGSRLGYTEVLLTMARHAPCGAAATCHPGVQPAAPHALPGFIAVLGIRLSCRACIDSMIPACSSAHAGPRGAPDGPAGNGRPGRRGWARAGGWSAGSPRWPHSCPPPAD